MDKLIKGFFIKSSLGYTPIVLVKDTMSKTRPKPNYWALQSQTLYGNTAEIRHCLEDGIMNPVWSKTSKEMTENQLIKWVHKTEEAAVTIEELLALNQKKSASCKITIWKGGTQTEGTVNVSTTKQLERWLLYARLKQKNARGNGSSSYMKISFGDPDVPFIIPEANKKDLFFVKVCDKGSSKFNYVSDLKYNEHNNLIGYSYTQIREKAVQVKSEIADKIIYLSEVEFEKNASLLKVPINEIGKRDHSLSIVLPDGNTIWFQHHLGTEAKYTTIESMKGFLTRYKAWEIKTTNDSRWSPENVTVKKEV